MKTFCGLIVCLLVMGAAALSVNKSLLGHKTGASQSATVSTDTISTGADGSVTIHTAVLTDADGYAGPTPLDVTVDKDGKITAVTVLDNAETPRFMERAAAVLDPYKGMDIHRAATAHVDAVSGATYTSNALITNVRAAAEYYSGHSVGKVPHEPVPVALWVALGVTLVACIVPLFVRNRVYLTVQMIVNVVVLGFWGAQFLDYTLMLKYLSSGLALPAGLAALCMLVAAFVYPLFGRPQHYCNYICPLGSAQALAGKICGYKIRLKARTVKALDWFRRILWVCLTLLLWMDAATGWMDLELFQVFVPQSAGWGIIAAAGVMLLLSMVIQRPYCRFVCPTGSLFKSEIWR